MRINNCDLLTIDGVFAVVPLGAFTYVCPVWIGHTMAYCIQLVITGVPAGSFKLQMSADLGLPNSQKEAQQYVGVNTWTDIPGTTQVASASGSFAWNMPSEGYNWVRVAYIASGVGSTPVIVQARANTKGV